MSGSIGNVFSRVTQVGNSAATIVRAVSNAKSAISAIFGGPGGINTVTLGDVDFQGFEIPEKITVGGTQQMTVHKLTGGERVIDAMGRDDRPLEWSGYLQGQNAVVRAQDLDAMRVSGAQLEMFWATYDYSVVVASFECDYQQGGFWLPYRISCTVLRDEAQADADADDDAVAPSIQGGLAGAIATVQGGIASAQSAISTAVAVGSQVLNAAGQISGALGISVPFLATASAGLAQAQGFANTLGSVNSGITQVQGLSDSLSSAATSLTTGIASVSTGIESVAVVDVPSMMTSLVNTGAAAVMSAANAQIGQSQAAVPIDPVTPPTLSPTAFINTAATSDGSQIIVGSTYHAGPYTSPNGTVFGPGSTTTIAAPTPDAASAAAAVGLVALPTTTTKAAGT